MNKCDICEVEWDPRTQEHRRGLDCAQALRDSLHSTQVLVKKLEVIWKEFFEGEKIREDATVKAFENQRNDMEQLVDRFDRLAKRVNLLEHPKLSNIRSMPKPGEE
jgi:hypothetical protein